LDQVASGRPSVVLVDGEAGIGKTRLLEETLRVASGRGMQVVSGKAGELEQTRPFGLVATVFDCRRSSPDARRVAIAELLAVGGAGDRDPITVTSDPGLRFRAVDAFADLAEDLALAGPLVIGADDLQWADPSSLLTLGALSRRLTYLPAALIGCLRPAPRLAELDQLLATVDVAGARRLTLHGLTETAVAELVADALAAQPGPVLLAEIGGAAGNPLFVTELLDALVDEGMITRSGERAELTAAALPPTRAGHRRRRRATVVPARLDPRRHLRRPAAQFPPRPARRSRAPSRGRRSARGPGRRTPGPARSAGRCHGHRLAHQGRPASRGSLTCRRRQPATAGHRTDESGRCRS
jgi:predicted ATPase